MSRGGKWSILEQTLLMSFPFYTFLSHREKVLYKNSTKKKPYWCPCIFQPFLHSLVPDFVIDQQCTTVVQQFSAVALSSVWPKKQTKQSRVCFSSISRVCFQELWSLIQDILSFLFEQHAFFQQHACHTPLEAWQQKSKATKPSKVSVLFCPNWIEGK